MTHFVVPRRHEGRLFAEAPMYGFGFDLKVLAAIWLICAIIMLTHHPAARRLVIDE